MIVEFVVCCQEDLVKVHYENRLDRPLQVSYMNDFVFPLHLHSEVEVVYACEGRVSLSIDHENYLLSPGEVAIVFPNVVHGYVEEKDVHGKGVFFLCPAEISADYCNVLQKKRPISPVLLKKDISPDLETIMQLMVSENDRGADPAVLRAYMQVVLARIIPALELRDARERGMRSTLYQLLSYLAQHCTEPVTLEDLATKFDLSVSYISHMFSEMVGINFRSYINALRLLRATRMLKCTDKPVTCICYECGFESQRTFNRAFREHYGVTPTEYRADWGHEAP